MNTGRRASIHIQTQACIQIDWHWLRVLPLLPISAICSSAEEEETTPYWRRSGLLLLLLSMLGFKASYFGIFIYICSLLSVLILIFPCPQIVMSLGRKRYKEGSEPLQLLGHRQEWTGWRWPELGVGCSVFFCPNGPASVGTAWKFWSFEEAPRHFELIVWNVRIPGLRLTGWFVEISLLRLLDLGCCHD